MRRVDEPKDPQLAKLLEKLGQVDEQVESHCNQLLISLHELRSMVHDLIHRNPENPA